MQKIRITLDEFRQLALAAMTLTLASRHAHLQQLSIDLGIPYDEGRGPDVPNHFQSRFQDMLWLLADGCIVTAPRPDVALPGHRRAYHPITLVREGEPSAHEIVAATMVMSEALSRMGLSEPRIADIVAIAQS